MTVDRADCQGEGDECYVHGTACKTTLREQVQAELLECYGEGENTDWPWLNDLVEVVVGLVEKHAASSLLMLPVDLRMELMDMVRIPLLDGRVFWQESKYEGVDG